MDIAIANRIVRFIFEGLVQNLKAIGEKLLERAKLESA